jgi:predicted RNA-binding protein YlqC (UPF0109 family)
VHLVGSIIKKFVTMHGHVTVKYGRGYYTLQITVTLASSLSVVSLGVREI